MTCLMLPISKFEQQYADFSAVLNLPQVCLETCSYFVLGGQCLVLFSQCLVLFSIAHTILSLLIC